MTATSAPTETSHAATLDAADPLRSFRDRFVIDDPDVVYLDGNSLGRLPRATLDRLAEVTRGADPRTLTGPDAAALAELQGEELVLAPVSIACEEDVLEPVISQVESELFGAPQA